MSSVSFRGKDRERAVLLLAGSVEDFGSWMLDPKGALQGKSASGLAGAKKVACRVCVVDVKEPQKGLVVDKFGRTSPCPACTKPGKDRGTGKVDADSVRGTDGVEHTVVVATVDTNAVPTKEPRTRRCPDCGGDGVVGAGSVRPPCKTCKGTGRLGIDAFVIADDTGVEKDPLDAYTAAIERRDKSGSYQDYLLLEAELRARSPHLLVPFRMVYVSVPRTPLEQLSERDRYLVRRARDFLTEWMPDPIRVPRWVVDADDRARAQPAPKGRGVNAKAREARDAEIRRRFREGFAVAGIASWSGLSVKRVNEIVYSEREVA